MLTVHKAYEDFVASFVKRRLNDNQFGALVSWAYNVGWGAVQNSDLISRLRKGENPNTVASQELCGVKLAGECCLDLLGGEQQK